MTQAAHILHDALAVKTKLANDAKLMSLIDKVGVHVAQVLQDGGQVLFCGNGGSAADAQHIAAELSGRFYHDRAPLNAEALHVNTSYLTAVANDYSYDEIYARLVQAKGKKGDILFCLSTSGNSKNCVLAAQKAKSLHMHTIALTGAAGGELITTCDETINVPSSDTARIQECHITIGHAICQIAEEKIMQDA